MKTIRTTIMLLGMLFATAAMAQENVEVSLGADVVSKYIWRGQDLGHAAVQPTVGVAYKGLSLSAWGSYGITDSSDTDELDLTLSYSTGGLTVGVTDYWFSGGDNRYFLYDAHRTAHVFEGNIGYDFGCLSLNWFTNFAGADGMNKDGKRAYSSYFEIAAPFKLGGVDWNVAAGAVPFATTSYADANGFAVVNLSLTATKEIKLTDSFSLPVFATVATNPSTQKAYLAFGVTISK